MLTQIANEDSRLSFWLRVREFAVPASMIETATARRRVGDWAGACAAAGVDVDLDLRTVARTYGRAFVSRLRADLRHLAPDLLRWHLPRIAPDGLLRPGVTVSLARYDIPGREDTRWPVHLVVRTPPAWADAGQRVSLALWDADGPVAADRRHPHPRPDRRFRLDLHRHLWDARRTDELRVRCGADRPPVDGLSGDGPSGDGLLAEGPSGDDPPGDDRPVRDPSVLDPSVLDPSLLEMSAGGGELPVLGCAVDRWVAEAGIVLRAEGRTTGPVLVRLGSGRRLVLDPAGGPDGRPALRRAAGCVSALPVLPDAATWVLPDLELIRTGAVEAGRLRLHPLVASALVPEDVVPERVPPDHLGAAYAAPGSGGLPDRAGRARFVECRGATHRIGLVGGVLAPLDHDPDQIRREELLAALTGTPLPCLQAIDRAHRRPDCLDGVRERLVHGDVAGALAVVEGLLGPEAVLRDGALRDELEAAARRRITYGLFRAGLIGPGPGQDRRRPVHMRAHPRHGIPR
ncbi:hypothetical protein [Streptomyces maremycinicus]|uniref:hypothetical protein n=1 Tax=Streptomyces maremycinicus TaxID=1679753 RepID=UPI000789A635|nr:hypothetical protein [Streptomyces sp. NBRC 110468]